MSSDSHSPESLTSDDFRGYQSRGLPLVSIVAICYNHEQFLEQTLDSIKGQTYPNIQLIIIDDFSKDNSAGKITDWIERNKLKCTFIPHQVNKGVCKTLNKGLSLCRGEYYQAISCDDVLLPEKTERHVKILANSDEQTGMVFSDAKYIDEHGRDLYGLYIQYHRQFGKVPSGKIFDELLQVNFIPAFAVLIKRSVFITVGFFDELLDYDDTDMWIRIANQYDIIFDDCIAAKYRLHSNNLHKTVDFTINRFNYCLKHVKESEIARQALLTELLKAYRQKHPQLSYMRKTYFSTTKSRQLLSMAISFRIPYSVYYLSGKAIRKVFGV